MQLKHTTGNTKTAEELNRKLCFSNQLTHPGFSVSKASGRKSTFVDFIPVILETRTRRQTSGNVPTRTVTLRHEVTAQRGVSLKFARFPRGSRNSQSLALFPTFCVGRIALYDTEWSK